MSNINKIKTNIIKSAIKDDKWLKEFKYRQKNIDWLILTFKIAIKILSALDEQNISKKQLAKNIGCSLKKVNRIIKGEENLTLKTITKIENFLNIKLI